MTHPVDVNAVELRFRRRAAVDERVPDMFADLFGRLKAVASLVASPSMEPPILDLGAGESAAANLTPLLVAQFSGAVSFASRLPKAIRDRAVSDDVLILHIRRDQADTRLLALEVFPAVIDAFQPYRASAVADMEEDLNDFEAICEEAQRTGRDVDGRDSVFKIQQIDFFDDELCRRSFGKSAQDVAQIVSGHVASAQTIGNGVLVTLMPSTLADGEANERSKAVLKLLGA